MMRTHKVTAATVLALKKLFGDERIGLSFLEIREGRAKCSTSEPIATRAARLRATLEDYIVNMASELEELGDGEVERLQAEARATLVALREILVCFPESEGAGGVLT